MTKDMTEQMAVEQKMLSNIMEGLRLAIGMKPEGGNSSRKRHTIHFIAQSLQRHLDHMLALEERDGYMDAVSARNPHLGRRVDALRKEHDQFRQSSRQVVHDLEAVSPTNPAALGNVCEEVLALLNKLEEHTRNEVDLIQEAFDRDGGGEG